LIKVLGILASPRKYGVNAKLLKTALIAAEELNAVTKQINLYDYEIKPCIGCLSDILKSCRPPCVIEDDMRKLYDYVQDSDVIIISTPVYWYSPPGQLKNFLDRLTVFENMIEISGRSLVEGKVAGIIAVGNDSGAVMTAAQILMTLNSMGYAVPPWGYLSFTIPKDQEIPKVRLLEAANVGRVTVLMARKIEPRKIEWFDPELLEQIYNKVKEEFSKIQDKDEINKRRKIITKLL